jgi:hypothetical protein
MSGREGVRTLLEPHICRRNFSQYFAEHEKTRNNLVEATHFIANNFRLSGNHFGVSIIRQIHLRSAGDAIETCAYMLCEHVFETLNLPDRNSSVM